MWKWSGDHTDHTQVLLLGVVNACVQDGRPLTHEAGVPTHVRRQDQVYYVLHAANQSDSKDWSHDSNTQVTDYHVVYISVCVCVMINWPFVSSWSRQNWHRQRCSSLAAGHEDSVIQKLLRETYIYMYIHLSILYMGHAMTGIEWRRAWEIHKLLLYTSILIAL